MGRIPLPRETENWWRPQQVARPSERLPFKIFMLLERASPTDCLLLNYNINWAQLSQLLNIRAQDRFRVMNCVSSIPGNVRVPNVKNKAKY